MISQFFLVSGWALWIVILIAIALDTMFLSSDDLQMPAVCVAAGVTLGVILFSDAFIGFRVSTLIACLAVYLAAGVAWSLYKWYDFVVQALKRLRDIYDGASYINKAAKGNETFESYVDGKCPNAAGNKQRIVGWMVLWPFSLTWWVLTWPRRAAIWLYERLSTIFDRIGAHVWKRILHG